MTEMTADLPQDPDRNDSAEQLDADAIPGNVAPEAIQPETDPDERDDSETQALDEGDPA